VGKPIGDGAEAKGEGQRSRPGKLVFVEGSRQAGPWKEVTTEAVATPRMAQKKREKQGCKDGVADS